MAKRVLDERSESLSISLQTALHLAITHKHEQVVQVFIDHKSSYDWEYPICILYLFVRLHVCLLLLDSLLRSSNNHLIIPNFTLKDSMDQTPFAAALWAGMHEIASSLMMGGASVNDVNSQGCSLLHEAIMRNDTPSCIFLLDNQVEVTTR